MTGSGDIRRADERDTDVLAAVIASAFHSLAVAAWLVPDDAERARIFPPYFAIFVGHGVRHGEVYTIGDREAVAIWFPPATQPVPDPDDYEARVAAICGPHLARFTAFDEALQKHHPHEPHHYLAFLAASPARRGAGLGTALLRDYCRRLTPGGAPAYLEASSERSRDLYLREGFRARTPPYRLPDGPPLYPLWRDP